MRMDTLELVLPEYWAVALVNGDESALNDTDYAALSSFTQWMVNKYGGCHCVDVSSSEDDDHPGFITYHDARAFLPLAADCAKFTFSV